MSRIGLVTSQEVAEYLRVQPSTVRRLASKGRIPAVKIGKQWRFSLEKIQEWAIEGSENNVTDKVDNSIHSSDTEEN